MSDPSKAAVDWDALELPVLTEVAEEPVLPVLTEDAEVEIPDFDFSAELDTFDPNSADETGLDIPPDLPLEDVVDAGPQRAERPVTLPFEDLPSLDLDVPIADELSLDDVLAPLPMAPAAERQTAPPQPPAEDDFEFDLSPQADPTTVSANPSPAAGLQALFGTPTAAENTAASSAPPELTAVAITPVTEALVQPATHENAATESSAQFSRPMEAAPLAPPEEDILPAAFYSTAPAAPDLTRAPDAPPADLSPAAAALQASGGYDPLLGATAETEEARQETPVFNQSFSTQVPQRPEGTAASEASHQPEPAPSTEPLTINSPAASFDIDSLPRGVLGGGQGPVEAPEPDWPDWLKPIVAQAGPEVPLTALPGGQNDPTSESTASAALEDLTAPLTPADEEMLASKEAAAIEPPIEPASTAPLSSSTEPPVETAAGAASELCDMPLSDSLAEASGQAGLLTAEETRSLGMKDRLPLVTDTAAPIHSGEGQEVPEETAAQTTAALPPQPATEGYPLVIEEVELPVEVAAPELPTVPAIGPRPEATLPDQEAAPAPEEIAEAKAVPGAVPEVSIVEPAEGPSATVVDEAALVESLYRRIMPRMKVELSLWLQDALEMQAKAMLSGVMQQLKTDYEMLFSETLRDSLRQALSDLEREKRN
ncbi:hypothetical protein Ga0061063_2059 [Gulbenkiania indica]|uniref:Uncharacterized protein n=1 Tax=Gulbenkiania indica TaxID=375574 RepID=A0A0K6H0Q9_9NEIS|nr:hypothetical protein [Gulbenkiania indica]CUA84349.1 hypothetical protein Ga0061063_2059 [Gulbenkiania indica]